MSERLVAGDGAHVVDLHDRLGVHELVDQVAAQGRQPARVAVRPGRIDRRLAAQHAGQRRAGHGAGKGAGSGAAAGGLRVVGLGPGAGPRVPELAEGELVPGVDHQAGGAAVHLGAAQRVVELVHGEERADPELAELVQAAVHLGLVTLGRLVRAAAAEQRRGLHAHDHRELAVGHHAPGLERVGHDAQEPLARAAVLGVDVVLQLVQALALQLRALHLVARVHAARLQVAQHVVVHQQRDHHPQARSPRALDPLPVRALVGQRVGAGPVLEGGVAHRILVRDGAAEVEQVLQRRAGPAGAAVLAAVGQRVGDAQGAERLAAVELAADELVRGQVAVGVKGAGDLAQPGRALERRALGAGGGLGEARAHAGAHEREAAVLRAHRRVDRPHRRAYG